MPKGSAKKVVRSHSSQARSTHDTSFVHDMIAIGAGLVACACMLSLSDYSDAPVAHACREALIALAGVWAYVIPIALIVCAAVFFINDERMRRPRILAGIGIILCAGLGLATLNATSAIPHELLLTQGVPQLYGGYIGCGIAFVLVVSCGSAIGKAVLCAIILAGVVVCGFSLSEHITKLFYALTDFLGVFVPWVHEASSEAIASARFAHEQKKQARIEAQALRTPEIADNLPRSKASMKRRKNSDDGDFSEPKTTFLGTRKTTVLQRTQPKLHVEDEVQPLGVPDSFSDSDEDAGYPAPKTVKLTRKKHPDLDLDTAVPAGFTADDASGAQSSKNNASTQPSIPEFLTKKSPLKPSISTQDSGGDDTSQAISSSETISRKTKQASTQTSSQTPRSTSRPGEGDDSYNLPDMSLLSSNPNSSQSASSTAELTATMQRLQSTLQEFGLRSRVVDYISGPLVTTFRVEMGEGERVNKIRNLEDDIALTLAAQKVRIFAPIAGTSYVGIEIPNKTRQNVHLGDVLPFATGGPLQVAVGRDSAGKPVITDIAKMPHMLVAGTTGSGKSVLINSMIMSLLMRTTPKQVRLIMVDPKRVEFSAYNGLPHLYVPVVTEPRQAASALQWAVSEMERRLKLFERASARDIGVYNRQASQLAQEDPDNAHEPLPYLVVIIDELSDLMMVAGKDVEASIVRLAQLARAAGIHLVIATQRPSANVVTGLIKSNIDSRVALKVSSGIDSRVILDETGAERLLGNGDMLFKDRGLSAKRVLGCYTSDSEIHAVVDFIRAQAEPDYHTEILSQIQPGQVAGSAAGDVGDDEDPLLWQAAQIVVEANFGSTSNLQRRLKIGYARAGRIMDMLEAKGIVGPPDGSKPREVLMDVERLEEFKAQDAQFRQV